MHGFVLLNGNFDTPHLSYGYWQFLMAVIITVCLVDKESPIHASYFPICLF